RRSSPVSGGVLQALRGGLTDARWSAGLRARTRIRFRSYESATAGSRHLDIWVTLGLWPVPRPAHAARSSVLAARSTVLAARTLTPVLVVPVRRAGVGDLGAWRAGASGARRSR